LPKSEKSPPPREGEGEGEGAAGEGVAGDWAALEEAHRLLEAKLDALAEKQQRQHAADPAHEAVFPPLSEIGPAQV
jgi:hypothetical protein